MALVNLIQKKAKMSREEIVRFQLWIHCYLKDISVSPADLDCFVQLALDGETDLPEFCMRVSTRGTFKNPQSVRNCIARAEHLGIITKSGKGRKRICIADSLQIQTRGNIVMDLKAFYASEETK